ncbi:hypothetical protein GT037_005894 [Alternaria burnsii]|uniref:Uncharacterized protein n=1 Tax=Alternaria burnsii TaxID=1187904 RepID=A0A8H7B4V0_9PLEO|nr:uncharacterized protein GT037_005894 [Alternaria burnsii]KAF7676389.1 hypothetical protein GT037_005894 [Alternaria burnsii]
MQGRDESERQLMEAGFNILERSIMSGSDNQLRKISMSASYIALDQARDNAISALRSPFALIYSKNLFSIRRPSFSMMDSFVKSRKISHKPVSSPLLVLLT